MQFYKTDKNGYYIEPIIADKVPSGCIETQPPQGLYKAKWTGTKWVEDMSQAEIDELYNQPKEVTENEMIMLAIADLAEIVLGGIE